MTDRRALSVSAVSTPTAFPRPASADDAVRVLSVGVEIAADSITARCVGSTNFYAARLTSSTRTTAPRRSSAFCQGRPILR